MIAVPDLDTIDFEALVEEGRGLIPRYAPAWTDHNLHDPGMTLLDLLAWFVDQQVYRIGFVGDEHIAAFAALLGVEPRGARPSSGLVWPHSGALPFDQHLPKDTRAHPSEQPELAFAVTGDIGLRAAAIASIEARTGATIRKLAPDEAGAILLDPKTEAIDLVFSSPLKGGVGPIALGLAYAEPLPDLAGRSPASISSRVEGEGWQRADATWCPSPDGRSGVILLPDPPEGAAVAVIGLDLGTGLPRRLLPVRIALNVIPIVQVEILDALKIGEGTGWPDLELSLGLEGDAVPAAEFDITSGPDKGKWERRTDFSASGPDDAHFLFDEARGTVHFGNGINGRAMPTGHEVSRSSLQVTLGARGNLAAGASWIVRGITVDGGKGFGINREALSGGADAWSREELLTELRRGARRRAAMLTDADMIGAASKLAGYGIDQAEVLPRFDPALPRHEVPGARTLLLRPSGEIEASDAWLDAIEGELALGRVLGERLRVAAVQPVPVEVDAELLVAAGSDQERIRHHAAQRLRERLSIRKRRENQAIEPWPAGRPVTVAELETLLASVEGVIAVTDLRLARVGEALARVSLPLGRLEAAVADSPVVRLRVES